MHSELFSFGPLTIHAYGACMALGFLLAWQAIVRLCKKTGQPSDYLSSLLVWIMVWSIAGARAAYVLEHWTAEFRDAPLAVFRIDRGGLMFYGGFIGAAVTLLVYARLLRKPFLEITDLLLAGLPLGHAFGRVGCFFHGCCHGARTDGPLGVCFPKGSPAWWEQTASGALPQTADAALPVLPTQLFEAALNAALFALLFALYPKHRRNAGFVSAVYCCAYGTIRFGMEYLRGDQRMALFGLSIGQCISLGVFATGVALFLVRRRKPSETATASFI